MTKLPWKASARAQVDAAFKSAVMPDQEEARRVELVRTRDDDPPEIQMKRERLSDIWDKRIEMSGPYPHPTGLDRDLAESAARREIAKEERQLIDDLQKYDQNRPDGRSGR